MEKEFPTVVLRAVVPAPTDATMYEWVDKSLESGEMVINQVFRDGLLRILSSNTYTVPQHRDIQKVYEEVQQRFERHDANLVCTKTFVM